MLVVGRPLLVSVRFLAHPPRSDASTHVNQFYRDHHYPSTAKPSDRLIVAEHDDRIVGAVRLTLKQQAFGEDIHFMRSLLVAPSHRKQGLGGALTLRALDDVGGGTYIFAFEDLRDFYASRGFVECTDLGVLPTWLRNDYERVAAQQQRKHRRLVLMLARWPIADGSQSLLRKDTRARLRLVLLQHINELSRATTATAPLLLDESLRPHVRVERWTWSGRADNADVERRLSRLERPALLWTDGRTDGPSAHEEHEESGAGDGEASGASYVLLDGTWQEARTLFRKGPAALRALPRVALRTSTPSTYFLRGDYGWRARFRGTAASAADEPTEKRGAGGGGGGAKKSSSESASEPQLLCTAEAGAAILEQTGRRAAAQRVRALLGSFQDEYVRTHPHLLAKARAAVSRSEDAGG